MEKACDIRENDSPERQAIHMLIRTNLNHKRMIEKRTTMTELHRTQHRMLMHISKFENIPSQKEIAEHFDISPAAVAVTLKKLESAGYIERSRADDDTRQNNIRITDKGLREIAETRVYFEYVDNTMFNNFTPDELEILVNLLCKANNNLRTLDCEYQAKSDERNPRT